MPTLPIVPLASQCSLAIAGIVEGFYGPPWSWADRLEVLKWSAARGLTDYVYAPKDDPKHRRDWRVLYDGAELAGFRSLVDESGLRIGIAISPGLSMDETSERDRAELLDKLAPLVDLGVAHIGLFLDDLPPDPTRTAAQRGEAHAALTTWLRDRLGARVLLSLVPTDYIGTQRSPYLDALAGALPDDVTIGWTGASVVNTQITADDARARADALSGRPPLLWDNVPVNDAVMSDRLFMGPLRGRSPELRALCSGYLANPMVQPKASMLPLASIAGWCAGDDPATLGESAADGLGWRVVAESCDGDVPQRLVAELIGEADGPAWTTPADALQTWLIAAGGCEAPGLEAEAQPWVDQTRAEATLAMHALSLFRRTRPSFEHLGSNRWRAKALDADSVLARSFGVAAAWPHVRRAVPCVFGPRLAVRPALRQTSTGAWAWRADAIEEDANATDDLVRLALDGAATIDPGAPLVIYVDGSEVARDPVDSFEAAPGSVVLARQGTMLNRLRL